MAHILRGRLILAHLSSVVFALLAVGPAAANTYIVDRFDDNTVNTCGLLHNDCALRGAIIKANQHAGFDIVELGAGTYTLSIAGIDEDLCQTGDLDVLDALFIRGEGPERTVIDADGIDRVLHMLASNKLLSVRGVTITGGNAGTQSGGGVFLSQGGMHLYTCVVIGNAAPNGIGGGIYDIAWDTIYGLEIYDSWITANSSAGGSALHTTSPLWIQRSTFSNNTGHQSVNLIGDNGVLKNSTVSGNLGSASGGVYVHGSGVVFSSCTLANNTGLELDPNAGTAPTLVNTVVLGSCGPGAVSVGGNLESPGDTCGLGGSDLVNVPNAMLSNLGWFGGPTPVHRPLSGSPTIDKPIANSGCPSTDQRCLSRPRDGGGSTLSVCDIGAVELAGAGEIFVETCECGFLTPWSVVVQ